jgi:thiamine biosynthesis protein ThiS
MITVNGKPVELTGETSIKDLIQAQSLAEKRVAAELNGSIVPQSAFDATLLHDEDKVELVHFVGGG